MRWNSHFLRAIRTIVALCVAWPFAWASPGRMPAQEGTSTIPGTSATQTVVQTPVPAGEAPDSPRATLRRFLALAEEGDFVRAAQVLMPDVRDTVRAADVARRIHEVVRRRVVFDLDSVSPLPEGDVSDAE